MENIDDERIEDLARMFGSECCMNDEKASPCLNCLYKSRQVIRFGYKRDYLKPLKLEEFSQLFDMDRYGVMFLKPGISLQDICNTFGYKEILLRGEE